MGNGKRGVAPCGHEGEAIIGQYYKCLKGCDSDDIDFVILDSPQCKKCGSFNVEDYQLDSLFYMFNPGSAIMVDTHCINCGHCWLR